MFAICYEALAYFVLLSLSAIVLAYLFVSVLICFIINSGKKI